MDAADNARDALPVVPASPAPRRVHLNIRRIATLVPVGILVIAAVAAAQPLTSGEPVQVPRQALDAEGGGTGQAMTFDPVGPLGPGGPLLALPAEPRGGGPSSIVVLDRTGIPARALAAYQNAEQLLARADAGCRVDWALVAAIGRVESNHGSFGGNTLGADGVSRPGIIGIALDGSRGTARITDTDGGALDRDARFDRAVGPMQFIPGTWRAISQDGDGDGRRDPQDIDDSATATGAYLCAGPGDLTRQADAYRAVFRYNHSDDYARTVMAIADAYRRGVNALPSGSLPAGSGSGGSMFADGSMLAGGSVLADGRPPASAGPAPAATRPTAPIVAGAQPPAGGSTATTAPPPPGQTDPVEGLVAGAVGAVGGAVGGLLPGGGGGGGAAPGGPAPTPPLITCTTSPTQPLPIPLPSLPLPSCSLPGLPLPPLPTLPPLLP